MYMRRGLLVREGETRTTTDAAAKARARAAGPPPCEVWREGSDGHIASAAMVSVDSMQLEKVRTLQKKWNQQVTCKTRTKQSENATSFPAFAFLTNPTQGPWMW